MGLVAVAQAERARQIAGEEVDFLDAGQQGLVDSLLVCYSVLADLLLLCTMSVLAVLGRTSLIAREFPYLRLFALLEEGLLARLGLFLIPDEILRLRDLIDLLLVNPRDIDLVRGGNDVASVDSAEGDAVDLEGARHQENALVERLEEDNALAPESAGEEDQDGARLERLPWLPRADGLADLDEQSH